MTAQREKQGQSARTKTDVVRKRNVRVCVCERVCVCACVRVSICRARAVVMDRIQRRSIGMEASGRWRHLGSLSDSQSLSDIQDRDSADREVYISPASDGNSRTSAHCH